MALSTVIHSSYWSSVGEAVTYGNGSPILQFFLLKSKSLSGPVYCGLCKSFSSGIAFHSPTQLHIAFLGCIILTYFLEALNLVDCAPLSPSPQMPSMTRKSGGSWDESNSLFLAGVSLWKVPFPVEFCYEEGLE